MSRYYLTRVSVEGFRGINNRDYPLEIEIHTDKVTSIFGRNGMGKSSLFEALVYAISGEVPRLSQMQTVENPDQYYVNKFHGGAATISLTFMADDTADIVSLKVMRDEHGSRTISDSTIENPEEFLNSINCDTLWIDYNKFNDFVMSKPLDRGREFAHLLGLSKISNLRLGLSALCNTQGFNSDSDKRQLDAQLRDVKDSRQRSLKNAIHFLGEICTHEVAESNFEPSLVASKCVEHLSTVPLLRDLCHDKKLEEVSFEECRSLIAEQEGGALKLRLQQLIQTKSSLEKGFDKEQLQADLSVISTNVDRRQALMEQSKGESYRELYGASIKIVESNQETDNCPLCEREWEHPSGLSLIEFVNGELEKFDEIVRLEKEIRELWQKATRNEKLIEIERLLREFMSTDAAATDIQSAQMASLPSEADIASFSHLVSTLDQVLVQSLAELEISISELSLQLPDSLVELVNLVHNSEELNKNIQTYVKSTHAITDLEKQLSSIDKWHEYVNKLAKECSKAETELMKETLRAVETDIQQIYETIMPNSDILPKMTRDSGSEKLYLQLEKFFGLNDLDAIPLLSESYRNALGISVYLAECKRRSYGGRFVVIDDVTSSFDSGHQSFLMNAIYNHIARPGSPDGLQVILLSHDGLLEKFFDSCSNNGWAWTSMKLQGLPPTGLLHGGTIYGPRVKASLDQKLGNGDVEAAMPLLRQYFEFRLMEIIRELQIRVPLDFSIRDDKKMLSNMIGAIEYELDLRQKLGDCCIDVTKQDLVRNTLIPSITGNFVSHYETGSTVPFSASFLKGILAQIDSLVDSFQYTCNCSGTPKKVYYRSMTQKRKGCSKACN